ncbi:hypothetical protein MKX03_019904 [Papaver bracteatum]|nr:hypothetical protein MKX03_019904 [Papaver bracteatum]
MGKGFNGPASRVYELLSNLTLICLFSYKKINLLCDVEEERYKCGSLINFLFVKHATLILVIHFVLFGV